MDWLLFAAGQAGAVVLAIVAYDWVCSAESRDVPVAGTPAADPRGSESDPPATETPPRLEDLDVDPPVTLPIQCPNPECGRPVTAGDLVPPGEDPDTGGCERRCRIGTRAASPLAGWTVVHR